MVTGGSKRIGRAISLALAGRGFDIALHYGHSTNASEEAAAEIRGKGAACERFQCDLSDMNAVLGLIPSVRKAFGRCDLLVNNASVFERATLRDTTAELLDRMLQINFKAPFMLSKTFAENTGSGHIINLLDTKIAADESPYFAYLLSKKALHDFTRMAAAELGPKIRVNGVAPGLILPSADTDPKAFERMGRSIPLRGTGDPSHIVRAVLSLLDNPFITGACVFVDGGEHLKSPRRPDHDHSD